MSIYNIAYIDTAYVQLKTLRFDTGTGLWALNGTGLNIFAGSNPKICMFRPNTVAYYSTNLKKLEAYRWNSATWEKLSINSREQNLPTGSISIACCYPSRIIFSGWKNDYTNDPFTVTSKYFNGSYYSTVDDELIGDGNTGNHLVAPTNINSYAYLADSDNKLKYVKIINGVHTLIGTPFTLVHSNAAMTGLYKDTVAIFDLTTSRLYTFQFNQTTLTWSQLGSFLVITGAGLVSMSAIDIDKIAFYDSSTQKLRTYYWNSSIWSQLGSDYTTLIGSNASLSSFSSFITFNSYNEVPLDGKTIWPISR